MAPHPNNRLRIEPGVFGYVAVSAVTGEPVSESIFTVQAAANFAGKQRSPAGHVVLELRASSDGTLTIHKA